MADREWLLRLAKTLSVKGDFFEKEGIRWIQISEETVMWIVERLRAIAERVDD